MELVNSVIVEINNREISILFWFSLLCLWSVFHKDIRSSFFNVLKAFFAFKLFIPILILILYISFIILILSKVGFWKPYLLKDSLVWFFGSAMIIYFNVNKINEEDGYIKKIIIGHFKLFVIIQFVVNTYVFHWLLELILIPFITLLGATLTVSQYKKEYQDIENILQNTLAIVGATFIIISFAKVFIDSDNFFSSITLHKLLLPFVLLTFLIPFIYFLALAILYETIFMRLKIKEYYKKNLNYIRFKIITNCHLNLNRLKRFQKIMFVFDLSIKDEVILAMKKIKSKV